MSYSDVTVNEDKAQIIDKVHFRLRPEKWDIFCQSLTQPARSIPNLQSLLKAPGLLDQYFI